MILDLPETTKLPEKEVHRLKALLQVNGLVDDSCIAVFVGGSVARGWQHARSDTDYYVICDKPWRGESNGINSVALEPSTVPTAGTFVDGERIELRYWQDDQVDQIFTKTTWTEFQSGDSIGAQLSDHETAFLSRLAQSITITGGEWMQRRQQQLVDSAFRSMRVLRWLGDADGYVRDAIGMMESGDSGSAVLSAQLALGASADALTLSCNEYSLEKKWRARRVRAIDSETLPFNQFWALTTMRTFDPEKPYVWVEEVLGLCRQIALDVEV